MALDVIGSPAVAIVVIGRNEGERLERCLGSIASMRPVQGGIETIYVDSASTDGSVERAARFGVRVISIAPSRPCAAAGRNAGWRAVSAPIVMFLDGDTVLAPDFVADSLRDFDDPRAAVVWGHRREISPRASIYNRLLDLDWIYPPGPSDFCGGDALIRRAVLEQTGGFDERLIAGEEPELCWRIRSLGYTVLHVNRAMTAHDLAMTRWSQYWLRAKRSGYAYAEISARFRHTGSPLWMRESRRNFLQGATMLGLIAGGLALTALMRSPAPIATAIAILAALAIRTAYRVKWKCRDLGTRLLYGLHSHLQHVPLMFGQLKYRRDRRAGRIAELIEYKHSHAGPRLHPARRR